MIRESSLYFFEVKDRADNTDHYLGFLEQLFEYLRIDGITGAHIVIDSLRFDRTQEIISLIEAQGHNAVFLPPYSPFLDPTEELFHQWMSFVRRKEPQTEEELYEAIQNSSIDITTEECLNYVRHSQSYLIKCLNREPIES